MKRLVKCLAPVVVVGSWLGVSSAQAATPRAYISVNGNDANTCNLPTTPCRTYVGAITQVTPGGTVVVMDSGTFGGGTISQSVTINAPSEGQDGARIEFSGEVSVDGSSFEKSGRAGLYFFAGQGYVADSQLNGNAFGSITSGAGVAINFERCGISNNATAGLWGTDNSVLRVGQSRIVQNDDGLVNSADSATVVSFSNNIIRGNAANLVGTITNLALQ